MMQPCFCDNNCDTYTHHIEVLSNNNESQRCWNIGIVLYCNSLVVALNQISLNDTCILLNETVKLTSDIIRLNVHNFLMTSESIINPYVTCSSNITGYQNGIGIALLNSSGIIILNINFKQCGGKRSVPNNRKKRGLFYISSALFFNNSINVTLNYSTIFNSLGYGVAIIDSGNILLNKLNISDGKQAGILSNGKAFLSGGALYMQFAMHVSIVEVISSYFVNNCSPKLLTDTSDDLPYGNGGGINILLLDGAVRNVLKFNMVTVDKNRALWGGGGYLYLSPEARSNKITFNESAFRNNCARFAGGGFYIIGDSRGYFIF